MVTSDDTLPPGGRMLRQAFEALVTTLDELGIRFAVIGGLALLQHTRIRATDDIDVLLAVPQIGLPELFDALRRRGFSAELERSVREFLDDGLTTVQFEGVLVDLMRPDPPRLRAHPGSRHRDGDPRPESARQFGRGTGCDEADCSAPAG